MPKLHLPTPPEEAEPVDPSLEDIMQEHGTAEMLNELDAHLRSHPDAPLISFIQRSNLSLRRLLRIGIPNWVIGHEMLRAHPDKWLRNTPIDDRDLALIKGHYVPWLTIGPYSFLKNVQHKLHGQPFATTAWILQNDQTLRRMLLEVGAEFIGFVRGYVAPRNWEYMILNIQIGGNIAPGVEGAFFSARSPNARMLLAGPDETCSEHPWDVMILRDYHINAGDLNVVGHIASRQYDILLMKFCEEFENPWFVLAIKDSGPSELEMSS